MFGHDGMPGPNQVLRQHAMAKGIETRRRMQKTAEHILSF